MVLENFLPEPFILFQIDILISRHILLKLFSKVNQTAQKLCNMYSKMMNKYWKTLSIKFILLLILKNPFFAIGFHWNDCFIIDRENSILEHNFRSFLTFCTYFFCKSTAEELWVWSMVKDFLFLCQIISHCSLLFCGQDCAFVYTYKCGMWISTRV